jgi:hypothetical protein
MKKKRKKQKIMRVTVVELKTKTKITMLMIMKIQEMITHQELVRQVDCHTEQIKPPQKKTKTIQLKKKGGFKKIKVLMM